MAIHASTKVWFKVESLYDDPLTLDTLLLATAFVDASIRIYLSQKLVNAGNHNVSIDQVSSVVTGICNPGSRIAEGDRRRFNSCVSVETTIEISASGEGHQYHFLDYLVMSVLRRAVDLKDYPTPFGAHVTWLGPNLASALVDVRFAARKELRIMNQVEQRLFHHAMRLALVESDVLQVAESTVNYILLNHQSVVADSDDDLHGSDDVRRTQETAPNSLQHLEVQALFLGRNPPNESLAMFQDAVISSIMEQSSRFLESLENVKGSLFESMYNVEAYPTTEPKTNFLVQAKPAEDLFQTVVYKNLDFFDTTKAAIALVFLSVSIVVGGLVAIYFKKRSQQGPGPEQHEEQSEKSHEFVAEDSDRTFLITSSMSDITVRLINEQAESCVRKLDIQSGTV